MSLIVQDLTKRYGDKVVVDHLSFRMDQPGVYALLGACALLSASQNAPLMAMCLVMELTEAPMNLFVPVVFISMISLLASHATLSVVERRSVTVLG